MKMCDLAESVAMLHVAGTPCTAYSTAGKMDGEDAMSFAHTLAWCGLRARLQEPLIVQECTSGFSREIFTKLLPMYDFTADMLCPTQVGWPVRRSRQWVVSLS